jgi:hypothetical protein
LHWAKVKNMILYFNPLDEIINIFNKMKPVDFDIIIEWATAKQIKETAKESIQGITIFPEKNEPISILINCELNLSDIAEILSHELAHVLAGPKSEHNERWEFYFNAIHVKFNHETEIFQNMVIDADLNFRKLMNGKMKRLK